MEHIRIPLKNLLSVSRIITLYYFDFSPDYRTVGEAHDFWEMVYVDSGQLNLQGGEQAHQMRQGQIIFHKPNEFHRVECDGTHAASVFILTFECRSPAMKFFYDKVATVPRELRSLMKTLMEECTRNFRVSSTPLSQYPDAPVGGLQLIRNYLECFLIGLMRQEQTHGEPRAVFFTSQENLEGNLARELTEYLDAHLYGRVTLNELSGHFHFGVSTLCGVFRRNTGQTILHYFLERKIDEAKRLLREEKRTISEISEILNFESPQYFSRMFRKYVGMSPREFRNTLVSRSNVCVWKV